MEDNKNDFIGNQGVSDNIVGGQYGQTQENANGYVGGVINDTQGVQGNTSNYAGGFINGENQIKEEAGSIAGTLDNPGFGGIYSGVPSWNNNVDNMTGVETQNGYVGGFVSQNNTSSYETSSNLPAKVSVWSKIKAVLFKEIDLSQGVRLSVKEEKVLSEVHDFLFQEITFKGIKEFFFGKKNK